LLLQVMLVQKGIGLLYGRPEV